MFSSDLGHETEIEFLSNYKMYFFCHSTDGARLKPISI